MAMTVRADMLNGFAICHGGFITTLAPDARPQYRADARRLMTREPQACR